MKRSTFTLVVPSGNTNEVCLYHTLNDHLVRVVQASGETLEDLFRKLETGKESQLTAHQREVAACLEQMGFVVPDDADERELFERWYRAVLKMSYRSYVATVLTSMSCNLRCPYCYEQGALSSSKFMSMEMAACVGNWLQHQMIARGVERMNIVFFGGEPLLNCQVIEEMCLSMRTGCESLGVGWKAGVITNGTLLTAEVAQLIAGAGVSWAKVTLDGDRDAHDRLRPYANGRGSFDRIFENLAAAAPYLRLMIGGNIDKSNIGTVPALLDRLASASWRDAIMSVRFKPIMQSKGTKSLHAKTACQMSAFTDEQVQWMLWLRDEIKARGLPVDSDPLIGPCDFYRPNVVSIGIDGALYPCAAFVGENECVMGNVVSGKLTDFGREVEKIRAWDKGCHRCPYLPVCAGGCRAAAYFQGKGIGATVCDKEFYRRMLPRYIAECNADARKGRVQESMFG